MATRLTSRLSAAFATIFFFCAADISQGAGRVEDQINVGKDIHHSSIGAGGVVYHSLRHDGKWTVSARVPAGAPKGLRSLALGAAAGELHIVALDGDGKMWHQRRKKDGNWAPDFGEVARATPDALVQTSIAGCGDVLQVCAVDSKGKVWHQIRKKDGNWTGFGEIGDSFQSVECAADDAELQVCAVANDGTLFHQIRRRNGSWTGFAAVPIALRVSAIGCVEKSDHLCIALSPADRKELQSVIRKSDGRWTDLAAVPAVVNQMHDKIVERDRALRPGEVGQVAKNAWQIALAAKVMLDAYVKFLEDVEDRRLGVIDVMGDDRPFEEQLNDFMEQTEKQQARDK